MSTEHAASNNSEIMTIRLSHGQTNEHARTKTVSAYVFCQYSSPRGNGRITSCWFCRETFVFTRGHLPRPRATIQSKHLSFRFSLQEKVINSQQRWDKPVSRVTRYEKSKFYIWASGTVINLRSKNTFLALGGVTKFICPVSYIRCHVCSLWTYSSKLFTTTS